MDHPESFDLYDYIPEPIVYPMQPMPSMQANLLYHHLNNPIPSSANGNPQIPYYHSMQNANYYHQSMIDSSSYPVQQQKPMMINSSFFPSNNNQFHQSFAANPNSPINYSTPTKKMMMMTTTTSTAVPLTNLSSSVVGKSKKSSRKSPIIKLERIEMGEEVKIPKTARKPRIRFDFDDPMLKSKYKFEEVVSKDLIFFGTRMNIVPMLESFARSGFRDFKNPLRLMWQHVCKNWWGKKYQFTFNAKDPDCPDGIRQRCAAMVLIWNECQQRYFNNGHHIERSLIADNQKEAVAKDLYFCLQRRCQQNRSSFRLQNKKKEDPIAECADDVKMSYVLDDQMIKPALAGDHQQWKVDDHTDHEEEEETIKAPPVLIDSRQCVADLFRLTSQCTNAIFNKAMHQINNCVDQEGQVHFNLNSFNDPIKQVVNAFLVSDKEKFYSDDMH